MNFQKMALRVSLASAILAYVISYFITGDEIILSVFCSMVSAITLIVYLLDILADVVLGSLLRQKLKNKKPITA